jgi:uncharacterized protein YigE (DUF2233 family)
MEHYQPLRFICFAAGVIQLLFCGNSSIRNHNDKTNVHNIRFADSDTSEFALQKLVDSAYPAISSYGYLTYLYSKTAGRIDSIIQEKSVQLGAGANFENEALNKLSGIHNPGPYPENIRQEVRSLYRDYFQTERGVAALDRDSVLVADSLQRMAARLSAAWPLVEQKLASIHEAINLINGPATVRIGTVSYRVFVVQRSGAYRIRIHANKDDGYTFESYKDFLSKKKYDSVFMITNGGMFREDREPQGLLVSDYKEEAELDTTSTPKTGNFYLYPNGIFYIDRGDKYHVLDSRKYMNQVKKQLPQYATQSGPLVVSNGKISSRFTAGSQNQVIRSGVGLVNEDRIVFIASETPVNFYDFSMVFLYYFGCNQALYLDGAISKMYFAGDKKMPAGIFGPMISVTKK